MDRFYVWFDRAVVPIARRHPIAAVVVAAPLAMTAVAVVGFAAALAARAAIAAGVPPAWILAGAIAFAIVVGRDRVGRRQ